MTLPVRRFVPFVTALALCAAPGIARQPALGGEAAEPDVLDQGALAEIAHAAAATAMGEADIPGAAVAVVAAGEVLLLEGFGHADVEAGVPVDPERSIFRLGSLSKPLTATTIQALLERHDFGLDDDVRPIVEDLPLRPAYDAPMTLRQLLTHTAGFNEELFGQHAADPASWLPLDRYLAAHLTPRFAPPGEVIAYADFNTSVAGLVASRLGDSSFEELTERLLLAPLGMASTTFRQIDLPAELAGRLAVSYGRSDGERFAYPRDHIHTTPAAGLQSTAADMARYLIALIDEDRAVMGSAAWREQKSVWNRHHPKLRGKALGLTEVTHGGRTMFYKDGQASGFHARLVLLPEERLGFFSVHNRSILDPGGAMNAARRFNRDLVWELLDTILPPLEVEEAPPPGPAPGFAERVRAYEGVYRTTIAARHTPEKLIAMLDESVVRREGEGLAIGSGGWVEVEPGLVQWADGGPFWAAFSEPEGGFARGRSKYLYMGAGAYERIPWYESSAWTMRLGGGFALVFALALLVLPWKAWRGSDAARPIARRALAVALLDLVFLIALGTILATSDVQRLFQGWPLAMKVALTLPLLALVPLAGLGRRLVDGTTRHRAGWLTVGLGGLTALAGVAFLAWLHLWNLLGWRI